MKKYQAILFDLDGTLSDPKIGITRSVQYALGKFGIVEDDLDKLESFIGPPLAESFARFYGLDDAQVQQAIEYYRERFRETGMFENKLYPQIPHLLERLKDQGKKLFIATSKPTVFSEEILRYFKIDYYFDQIVGSNLDGTRVAKTEIIAHIIAENPHLVKNEMIMVGDRKHDIIGAQNTGIDSIGVLYGYGSLEEMRATNPTYLAEDLQAVGDILLGEAPLS